MNSNSKDNFIDRKRICASSKINKKMEINFISVDYQSNDNDNDTNYDKDNENESNIFRCNENKNSYSNTHNLLQSQQYRDH